MIEIESEIESPKKLVEKKRRREREEGRWRWQWRHPGAHVSPVSPPPARHNLREERERDRARKRNERKERGKDGDEGGGRRPPAANTSHHKAPSLVSGLATTKGHANQGFGIRVLEAQHQHHDHHLDHH